VQAAPPAELRAGLDFFFLLYQDKRKKRKMGHNILFKEYDPLYMPRVPGYAQALGETGAENDFIPLFVLIQKVEQKNQGQTKAPLFVRPAHLLPD
jgi:hypothetical protein